MRALLLCIAMLSIWPAGAQSGAALPPGHMRSLSGQILDGTTKDTLALAGITLRSANGPFAAGRTDFDGNFRFRFCSNRLPGKSLTMEFEELGYHSRVIQFDLASDTVITVLLVRDPMFVPTEENRKAYLDRFRTDQPPICGTDRFECKNNQLWRHCDGRIDTYQHLIERGEHLEEWEPVQ